MSSHMRLSDAGLFPWTLSFVVLISMYGQETQTVLAKPEKALAVKAVGGKSSGQCFTIS